MRRSKSIVIVVVRGKGVVEKRDEYEGDGV